MNTCHALLAKPNAMAANRNSRAKGYAPTGAYPFFFPDFHYWREKTI